MRTNFLPSMGSSRASHWETARIDHPFGTSISASGEPGLGVVTGSSFHGCGQSWRSYASERGLDLNPAPLETAFRLPHALFLLDNDRDPLIAGTIDEHLAAI